MRRESLAIALLEIVQLEDAILVRVFKVAFDFDKTTR